MRALTVALTQALARRFRDRPEDALLVLTRDYETLDFVLVERELAAQKGSGRGVGEAGCRNAHLQRFVLGAKR